MNYESMNKSRLPNLMRVYARAGRWEEARRIGEIIRRGSREPQIAEGDPTVS